MTYYQIDGKIYYFNLDAVFELVSKIPNNEKIINTTITQYYGGDSEKNANNGKEIVESKGSVNEAMSNVRYDFIKYLVSGHCIFICWHNSLNFKFLMQNYVMTTSSMFVGGIKLPISVYFLC